MSTYNPVASKLGSITLPADGENIDAADVNGPFQDVSDAVTLLQPTTTREVSPGAVRSISGLLAASPAFASLGTLSLPTSTDIENSHTQLGAFVTKTANTMADAKVFDVPLVALGHYNGYTLTTAVVRVMGKAGHAGVPAMLPRIAVVRHGNSATTGLLSTNWALDASASTGAYEVEHAITFTADQNNVIDTSLYEYSLLLQNEGSTNATNGLQVRRIILTLTAP